MTHHTQILQNKGDRYGDFVLTNILPIEELKCELKEIEHMPTGAKIMHIDADDKENLFCLSFQTLPSNSNGVAHILEHTVLCGSKKFPVKDPFFAMGRRSLNTFLNALTGSDFTCYPAATQVEKDFYNLLEVYLDAVFHPELKELSFLQEGHRLEFLEPADVTTPLVFKGIVFNEMKGALASAESRLWHAMMEELCKDLPYAHNSGGDPKEIPSLTYEQLKEFHQMFYQPSRCLFFFYGNLPLKGHLDFILKHCLASAKALSPLPSIPKQKRFKEPVFKKVKFPVTETEELGSRTMVAFGWLTAPLLNQEDVLALSVLDSVLMDTDASLLKLPLLNSELCIQADAFMDTEMSEVPLVIVCKGTEEKHADALEKILRDALLNIVEKGIPSHLIESALHQLEFSRSEITGDHSPFGLTLFMRAALGRQHGVNPENALQIHTLFDNLRELIKDPHYLTDLIKKYLLDNTHFVRLTVIPDALVAEEEVKAEEGMLKNIKAALSEKDIKHILDQTIALEKYQEETESQDIACLPKVDLSDVPVLARKFILKEEEVRGLTVFHHDCFTNHIIYADLIFDLPSLSEEELLYLQLFNVLLPELGAGKRNYAENLEYHHAYTGGIGCSTSLHVQAYDPLLMRPCLSIRGKALYRNTEKLFAILQETVTSARFDEKKRIKELISQLHNALLGRLSKNALRYAIQLSLSGFGEAPHISNQWHGLAFYHFIHELTQDLNKKLPLIMEKLNALKEKVLCTKNPHLVLSADKEMYFHLLSKNFYGLLDLPQKDFIPWKANFSLNTVSSQARVIATPVAYNVKAFEAPAYLHPNSPALTVATHLFENKVLHRAIREQGGAYGAGASYNPTVGAFYFHSYRDPHIENTLKIFDASIDFIADQKFNDTDLEESKLEVVQHLDMPTAPGSRAITAYSWHRAGKTPEMRQSYRDRLLAVTSKEIAEVVQKTLLSKKDTGTIVTFAGSGLLEKENKHLPVFPI